MCSSSYRSGAMCWGERRVRSELLQDHRCQASPSYGGVTSGGCLQNKTTDTILFKKKKINRHIEWNQSTVSGSFLISWLQHLESLKSRMKRSKLMQTITDCLSNILERDKSNVGTCGGGDHRGGGGIISSNDVESLFNIIAAASG